ncbi:glutathione S-transferase [Sinisalibacter aestuarii]|uniref:Glutathione S-transferase n=1 Tax=Sinisalibacter aestuarii TaxID=2949426 RepID=A0ABQ5LW04_9RHOB|nr:glutathione S-transferase [Sinisalibacter aestuarii]GKY88421.1 glutathione S-transferase [Sinisalibacter aestuarii]
MTDYTLYYWPIPFRGHFVRYVLAHAGARWDEPGFDAVVSLKNEAVADQAYPFMAPPLLVDHEAGRRLSQLPAILMYLGRKHRLVADEDETLRIVLDAMDVLTEITRWHGAQMWDRAAWATFAGARLPRWMQIHERIGRDHGLTAEAGFALGTEAPGLADLVLAALWHTMVDRLPGLRPLLHEHAPAIEGLADRIAAGPGVAGVIAAWKDRGPLYCAGEIEASILDMLAG